MARPRDWTGHPLVLALARGQQLRAACRRLQHAEDTARKWAALPEFRQAVQAQKQEWRLAASGQVVSTLAEATRTVLLLMRGSTDDRVKLRAALAVHELANKLWQDVDLERKVAELEEVLARQQQGPRLAPPA